MQNKFLIVVNPSANDGNAKSVWNNVRNELNKRKIPYDFRLSKYRGHINLVTEQLIRSNYYHHKNFKYIMMVIGGDSSINEVISSINNHFPDLKQVIPVSFIPAGHNNNFAISNHVNLDWKITLKRILNCQKVLSLKIGHFTDKSTKEQHYFLNSLEIGLGSDYLNEQSNKRIPRFKIFRKLKKLLALIMTIYNLDTFPLRLFMNKHYYQFNSAVELLIQNNSILNEKIKIIKKETIPKDKFRIIVVEKKNFLNMIMVLYRLALGKKVNSKSVHYYLVDKFSLNDSTLRYGSIDSKVIGSKFFDLKCDLINYPFWL